MTITNLHEPSESLSTSELVMKTVDNLMSNVKGGAGMPTIAEQAIFPAAIVFAYAVWENFIEDLAVEVTERLASTLPAQMFRKGSQPHESQEDSDFRRKHLMPIRNAISESIDATSLAFEGWQYVWLDMVNVAAKGSGDGKSHGLNSASASKTQELFRFVGVQPLPATLIIENTGPNKDCVPPTIALTRHPGRNTEVDVAKAIDLLIVLRGEAVHTGKMTTKVRKHDVLWWASFVSTLCRETDKTAREQVGRLEALSRLEEQSDEAIARSTAPSALRASRARRT